MAMEEALSPSTAVPDMGRTLAETDGIVAEPAMAEAPEPEEAYETELAEVYSTAPTAASVGSAPVLPSAASTPAPPPTYQPDPRSTAERFIRQQEQREQLTFQEPHGYWRNRYLPGDPLMRVLAARLARLGDNHPLQQLSATARQNWQPFDPPRDAALALHLAADKAAIATPEPTRLRLQVGLQGTPRRSGQRPAMNLAMVVDSHGLGDTAQASAVRALLLELARTRQAGDQFSLWVSGHPQLHLDNEQFRFGALQLTQLPTRPPGDRLEALRVSLQQAATALAHQDDPDAPLGASTVLLVTTGDFEAHQHPTLEDLAHRQALEGITLSVVALGANPAATAIERLVLAGQGQRWTLDGAAAAPRLAEEVLYAASRAVARAVRLRIELASGVKLIQVLGADKLVEAEIQQVREAEQSIDLRMARTRGIQADRGEDEAGIQIVIPHYYADTAHVVLLDVLVSGPGPVADVGVRYKDLVYGRNGVAQAQLSLPTGDATPGPLQHNVVQNLLAYQVAEHLRQAGDYLQTGQTRQARHQLADGIALLQGMPLLQPNLERHAALEADLALLQAAAQAVDAYQQQLSPVLQLAAYRRLIAQ